MSSDVCPGCSERWEERGLPGKILVTLKNRTIHRDIAVVVCPWCDGEPIVAIAAANAEG